MKFQAQIDYVKKEFSVVTQSGLSALTWTLADNDTVLISQLCSKQLLTEKIAKFARDPAYTFSGASTSEPNLVQVRVDLTKVLIPKCRETWLNQLNILKAKLQDLIVEELKKLDIYDQYKRQKQISSQITSQISSHTASSETHWTFSLDTDELHKNSIDLVKKIRASINAMDHILQGKGINQEIEIILKTLTELLNDTETSEIRNMIENVLDVPESYRKAQVVVESSRGDTKQLKEIQRLQGKAEDTKQWRETQGLQVKPAVSVKAMAPQYVASQNLQGKPAIRAMVPFASKPSSQYTPSYPAPYDSQAELKSSREAYYERELEKAENMLSLVQGAVDFTSTIAQDPSDNMNWLEAILGAGKNSDGCTIC